MRERLHIRVLAFVVRLLPPTLRRRSGAEILATAREAATAGRRAPWRTVGDGLLTLARAWLDAGRESLRRLHPRRSGAAFLRDAALALRGLRRQPLQGAVVVGTLALALGANGAIYTVTHAVLLRTLPYDGAERLMAVSSPPLSMVRTADDGLNWRPGAPLTEHEGVEATAVYFEDAGANLVEGEDASRVRLTQVSADFFRAMGVRMHLGPGLTAADEGHPRAVLGYELWRTAYGGDAGVLGRTIHLSGHPYVVVGVAPPGVDFPGRTELWLTDPPVWDFYGGALGPSIVARLRPGAGPALQAALDAWDAERRAASPADGQYFVRPGLDPLLAHMTAGVRLPLLLLAGAAGVVLLLGCVNVAGVLLARVAARESELAVRRALGAGRSRIFAQVMGETLVLAVLAGMLSVLLALAVVPALRGLLPADTPRLAELRPGVATLAFAMLATVAAGLAAGLPPAVAAAAHRTGPGQRAHRDRRGRQRVLGVLTCAQVALATVLVVTAGLLGRSLAELRAVPLGYDTEGVLTLEVRLPRSAFPDAEAQRTYVERATTTLARLPGVVAVGASSRVPLAGSMGFGQGVRAADGEPGTEASATYVAVTDGFFASLGVPLVAGGLFSASPAEREVVLSAGMADSLFGSASAAVGRQVSVGTREPWTARVVGVAGDVRFHGPEDGSPLALYVDLRAEPVTFPALVVRTTGEPAALVPSVRSALAEVDSRVPPFEMRSTASAVGEELAARRAVAVMAELFGAAALLLAVLALYGLLAQGVAQRRRELGVRLALGASRRGVTLLVVRRGMLHTLVGLAGGVTLSLAAVRLVEGLLFRVPARDTGVLVAAAATVLAAALLASWIPARRAARTDPATSLRAD